MLLDFNRRLGKGFSRDELALVQRFLDSVIRRVDARGL
jgi:hypothetical protein